MTGQCVKEPERGARDRVDGQGQKAKVRRGTAEVLRGGMAPSWARLDFLEPPPG